MENFAGFATWGKWVAGRRSKWLTLIIWIVAAAVLSVIAPSVNGQESNNASDLPSNSPSVVATAQIQKQFPSQVGNVALIVWYRASGLTNQDLADIQQSAKALRQHPVSGQKSVAPFDQLPTAVLAHAESKDGTTLVLPVAFQNQVDSTTLKNSLAAVQNEVTTAVGSNPFHDPSVTTSGLHARITGPAGIATDALSLFKNADVTLLAATTMLVLVLLILLYRSPVLAFVPLIGVGFAYGIISPVLGWLAKSGVITVDAQGVSIMTVLLFGAGTDYCLFLVARYREFLYEYGDKHEAIRRAVGGAAGAIIMSGLTVVLSLFTLIFARYGSDHRFAVPFSLSILIMAFAGVTLVPALLAILGRRSFFPAIPRTAEMWSAYEQKRKRKVPNRRKSSEPGRVSRWIGRVVSERPWTVVITSVVVLLVLAALSTQIKFTYNLLQSFPKTMPSRQGFTLLSDHYSPGQLAPVQMLIDTQGQAAATVDSGVADATSKLPFVKSVGSPRVSRVNPDYQLIQVTLNQDPYSMSSMSNIPQLQRTVVQSLKAGGVADATDRVWIGGETATQYDTEQLTLHDTKVIIPLVIGVIAVLLLLYLRSVVAMLYLILTVLLSYFSSLGTGWLVLHGIMGADAIQGAIPLYAFVFLVALGEDYNIFMVSRIWEAKRHGTLPQAIYQGVSRTSSVITSAGLILAGTFAVLAGLPIQILVQFGILTAIGVLLDTFVVRPFVVPALTAILGRVAFWPGRGWRPEHSEPIVQNLPK